MKKGKKEKTTTERAGIRYTTVFILTSTVNTQIPNISDLRPNWHSFLNGLILEWTGQASNKAQKFNISLLGN
jgi:hypothetical protein